MSDLSAEDGASDADDPDSGDFKEEILRRLENDDPELTELWVKLVVGGAEVRTRDGYIITDVEGVRDTEVLGKFLGRCTHITELFVSIEEGLDADDIVAPFLAGLQSNRSINSMQLTCSHIPQDFFRMLKPFIASNPNLVALRIDRCEINAEQLSSLSLALGESKSLKNFSLIGSRAAGMNQFDNEQSIVNLIEALKMHPQLEGLHIGNSSVGRNACTALSDLFPQLDGVKRLFLYGNNIDDLGVELLVDGLAHCRCLRQLQLAMNPSITARGWRALSTLLEDPNSRLALLNLMGNGIDDEIAVIFAIALAHNNTLTELQLQHNAIITSKGWDAFSKVLCDTSSANSTFLSNHRLQLTLGENWDASPDEAATFESLMTLNKAADKKRVAFAKVLLHHDDFDMQQLFEWDFKVLPCVIGWFERAAAYEIECEAVIQKRKLAAVYQFVRGMPELAIDGIAGACKTSAKVGGERPYSATCE